MLKVLANIFTNPGKHLANIRRNPSKHLASICTNIWKLQCSIFSATSAQTLQKGDKDAEMLPLKYMIEWNIQELVFFCEVLHNSKCSCPNSRKLTMVWLLHIMLLTKSDIIKNKKKTHT